MNTGIRRFILRLIVGLLTFIIGVAVAMALGGFRPFQGFTSSPNYMYRRSVVIEAAPAIEYREYREHGCRMRHEPPPPPPMVDAPLPPAPPRSSRY
jgi:hypothetical protein